MINTLNYKLILVDGSLYLYRAYYAFPNLTNRMGEPVGAIYGVIKMLKGLIKKFHPSHIAIIFDAKGKTFRNELFKKYKCNRSPMPDALQKQILPIHKIIKAMGLFLITIAGVEADDVIGTIAIKAVKNGFNRVLISTEDKDMAQLVSSEIALINTTNNNILFKKEVQLKFGVIPELMIDYLALVGDYSDNIPGVPGIGKKIAQVLLNRVGGLKVLYQDLNRICNLTYRGAKMLAIKLENNRDTAFMSYELATIKTDVLLNFSFNCMKLKKYNKEELITLFQRYEFNQWLNDLL